MSFLQPLGFLGLLAIPIIVIIYILRSRYKSKNVSSTFIWKRSLKYVKRRIPLNFIMSLLLILQILIVVAASFAIARPTVKPLESKEKIIIVDASASMLAEDGGITRFEHAKQLVEKASNEIGSNSQVTLILAGETAQTLSYRESDQGKFLTALRGITCSQGVADITGALQLASRVLDQNTGAKIFYYTDKEYIETDGVQLVDCKRETEWNVGVISLVDKTLAAGTEFIAGIANYGASSSCSVKLLIDGKVVAQKGINLEDGEVVEIKFTHSPTVDTGDGQIRVQLTNPVTEYKTATVQINSDDSFNLDDSITLYPREKLSPKIMYISNHVVRTGGKASCDTSLLYRALISCGYTIDSSNMYSSPEEVDEFVGYDLYIFEGVDPYELPSDGAVWLLNVNKVPQQTGIKIDPVQRKNENGFAYKKSLSLDVVKEIVENVNYEVPSILLGIKATINDYYNISDMGAFKPVFTASRYDGEEEIAENVFIAGNVGNVRMIVSTFDMNKSTFIAFVSDFPLMLRNMVSYSIPDPLPERVSPVGETVIFNIPAGATNVKYNIDGELVSNVDITKLQHEIKIDKPAKYELVVTYPDGDDYGLEEDVRTYVVTGHTPEEESMITQRIPSDSLDVPEPEDGAKETFEPVEIFPYLIALLILLLIIEWGVYYRDQY